MSNVLECCANCARKLNLEQWDYKGNACVHTKQEGFVCLALAAEGDAIWMLGLDVDDEYCEMFKERENHADTQDT